MTLYRHATGLDRSTLESEMAEILTKKGMQFVFSHDVFTLESWLVLIGLISQRCPAFSPMVDRLKQDLEAGREPAMKDLIFWRSTWKMWLPTRPTSRHLHTLSKKTKTVVFRVQTPNLSLRIWP